MEELETEMSDRRNLKESRRDLSHYYWQGYDDSEEDDLGLFVGNGKCLELGPVEARLDSIGTNADDMSDRNPGGGVENTMMHIGMSIYQADSCTGDVTPGRMKIAMNHEKNCQEWFGEGNGYSALVCNGRDTMTANYFGDNSRCSGSPLFTLDLGLDNFQLPATLIDDINDMGLFDEL